MTDTLNGTYDADVYLTSLTSYAILATLADKPVAKDSRQLLIDVVLHHISVDWEMSDPAAIQILTLDIMPIGGDEGFAWHVEMDWIVWCDEEMCGHVARHQPRFSGSLCATHLDEAYAQEEADLENDDIKAGIRQP